MKDGSTARYIYYGCCRSRDAFCKNKYLREEELIGQLIDLMGSVELDLKEVKERFEVEMRRHSKFKQSFLGAGKAEEEDRFDPVKYATYVLREGSEGEKRELLGAVKSGLVLRNKKIECLEK